MEILIQISLAVMISFCAYCNLFYQQRVLPYAYGYVIFAIAQWALLAINLIRIYGGLVGLIASVVLFTFGAEIVTNFSTNQIYRFIFKDDPRVPLLLFTIFVWINIALTVVGFLVKN